MSEKPLNDERARSRREDRGRAAEVHLGGPIPVTAALAAISAIAAVVSIASSSAWVIGLTGGAVVAIAIPPVRRAPLRWPTDWKACAIAGTIIAAGALAGLLVGSIVADSSGKSVTNRASLLTTGQAQSPAQASYPLLAAVAGDRALRIALQPTTPSLFKVAFRRNLGEPAKGVGWRRLHEQGGVDVAESTFALTLTNRAQLPVTVTNIVAEVITSAPAPTEWLGGEFSQGVGGLDRYAASFESEAPGSQAVFYRPEVVNGTLKQNGPFFATHQITLKPGEIYDASVTIQTAADRELLYRFVVSGDTPSESFNIHVSPKAGYRISGELTGKYASTYSFFNSCWETIAEDTRRLKGEGQGRCG